jgi:hypothetical protein
MRWVKITGGTGVGQIRAITNNTGTVLTVVPAWTTPPSSDSTYTIIEPEVKLFDSGATYYVRAGVYLPELPTSTKTDSGVTIAINTLTSDPKIINVNGNEALNHALLSSSPAIGEGIVNSELATDYKGVARPQGVGVDMGAFEFVSIFLPWFK